MLLKKYYSMSFFFCILCYFKFNKILSAFSEKYCLIKLPSLVTPTNATIQVTMAATLLALKLIFFTAATAHQSNVHLYSGH